jgi:NADP-dependent 3-hydroxy acid dehydrogenase YdfG
MDHKKVSLKGKVAIVTGGSSGIGLETSKLLSSSGCTVIMIGRDYPKLKKTSNTIENSHPFSCDVTDFNQVKDVVGKVISEFGRVDILVNNAGIYDQQAVVDLDMKKFEEMLKINLIGVANCCNLVVPHMLKVKSGTIIQISSGLGKRGLPNNSAYCASKFGLHGFTECLDLEVKDHINVSTVLPGQTNTPIFDWLDDDAAKEKMLHPKYIADAVLYLCELPVSVKVKEMGVRANI